MAGYRSLSYGFGGGMRDHFAAIVLHKHHVNLQFYRGVDLSDPDDLLEGTGKAMRHVKIRDVEAVEDERIAALIRQAVELTQV